MISISIYTHNRHIPENAFTANITLPAEAILIEDALSRARYKDNGQSSISIGECIALPELEGMNIPFANIDELNFLAGRLSGLSRPQLAAFGAILGREEFKNGASIRDLINISYGLDDIPVWAVGSDEEYGRMVVENNLLEDLENIPESALGYLDYAKIGGSVRTAEGGEFRNGMYVVTTHFEMPDIYDGIDLPEENNDHTVFRLCDSDREEDDETILNLPCDPQMLDDVEGDLDIVSAFPCIDPNDFDDSFTFEDLNALAERIAELSEDDRIKLRAVCSAHAPHSCEDVLDSISSLDEYQLDSSISYADDFAKVYLAANLPEDFDTSLLDSLGLYGFGTQLMNRLNASSTPYGILSAKGGLLTEVVKAEGIVAEDPDITVELSDDESEESENVTVSEPEDSIEQEPPSELDQSTDAGGGDTGTEQDLTAERLDVVEVFDQTALFSNARIFESQLPEGLYKYDLRQGGEMAFASMEKVVGVDHAGTLISSQPFDFADDSCIPFDEDSSPNFLGYDMSLEEYMNASFEQSESQDAGGISM